MTRLRKIAIGFLILGFIMFLIGVGQFTYRGEPRPFLSSVGMYCFVLWLPTTILGFVLILFSKNKTQKQ